MRTGINPWFKRFLEISLYKHGSCCVFVVGHHDCAGNPVDKETPLKHISGAVKRVKSWFPDVGVIGLWVNEKWEVEPLQH